MPNPARGKRASRKGLPKPKLPGKKVPKRPRIIRFSPEVRERLEKLPRRYLPADVSVLKFPIVPAEACDLTALCKYIKLLAPPGPGDGTEAYLTTLANQVNLLVAAVTAIESVLFHPDQALKPVYVPYFITDPNTGNDPPEKGGTPPPPGFPPP